VIACRSIQVRPGRFVRALAISALVVCLPMLFVLGIFALAGEAAKIPLELFFFLVIASILARLVLRDSQLGSRHAIELAERAIKIRAPRMALRPARVVRAGHIEDGYAPTPDRLVLRLEGGAVIEATLEGGYANGILQHLGVTLEQRTLRVPLRGAIDTFANVLVAWCVVWLGTLLPMNVLHIVGPLYAFTISMTLSVLVATVCGVWFRPNATVGLDGIRITGVLHPKFIPYSSITSAKREHGADTGIFKGGVVVLGTTSGEVRLFASGQSHDQVDALFDHIERGRAAAAAVDAPPLDALDRKGRSVEEWRTALGDPAFGEAGFRSAGLGQVELDDVLADPNAPLERRVAAALALRSRDDEARRRIRVAAATSADPHLRIALDAASADEIDDRRIARALEEAEERGALRMPLANPDPEG
jgi:hypothetical protein